MADIASSNVTYTKIRTWIAGKARHTVYTVAFGNATLTYPTGGVPLILASLGLKRYCDVMIVNSAATSAYTFKSDVSGLKVIMETAAAEAANPAIAATTITVYAIGW